MHAVQLLQKNTEKSCPEIHIKRSQCLFEVVTSFYEEVHELKYYANYGVHKNFLNKLASILPVDCRPIVITDAGFRNTWFSLITKLNWDFIGRLRYNTFVQTESNGTWDNVRTLHSKATNMPKYLGLVKVARNNPIEMNMYMVLGKDKGRMKKTRLGIKCQSSNSKKYAKGAKEPWVVVTSLLHQHNAG